MTWKCKSCEGSNAWWKNVCEGCGKALHGFDDVTPEVDPLLKAMLEAIEAVEKQHDRHQVFDGGIRPSCRCSPLAVCNNVACPNQMRLF